MDRWTISLTAASLAVFVGVVYLIEEGKEKKSEDGSKEARVESYNLSKQLDLDELLRLQSKRASFSENGRSYSRAKEKYEIAKMVCSGSYRNIHEKSQLSLFLSLDRPTFGDDVSIDDFAKVYSVMDGAIDDDLRVAYQALREYGVPLRKATDNMIEDLRSVGGSKELMAFFDEQSRLRKEREKEYWNKIMETVLTKRESELLKDVHLYEMFK